MKFPDSLIPPKELTPPKGLIPPDALLPPDIKENIKEINKGSNY